MLGGVGFEGLRWRGKAETGGEVGKRSGWAPEGWGIEIDGVRMATREVRTYGWIPPAEKRRSVEGRSAAGFTGDEPLAEVCPAGKANTKIIYGNGGFGNHPVLPCSAPPWIRIRSR